MPAAPLRCAYASLLALGLPLAPAIGQVDLGDEGRPSTTVLRDGFESDRTAWREEATDASFLLRIHERTDLSAHEGSRAERLVFLAGPGSGVHYSYALTKIPVVEELAVSLYVRSNRPGVQIFGRVVLPEDRNPETGLPTSLIVPGTIGDMPDRWQHLELTGLPLAIEQQARVLRLGSGRKVRLDGAYLERIVVNLYGGPVETEVLLDELVVSPVPEGTVLAQGPADSPTGPSAGRPGGSGGGSRVKLSGPTLRKDGADWVPRIVRAPGADPGLLFRAGFDVLALGPDATDEQIATAERVGMMLMPSLAGTSPTLAAGLAKRTRPESVAFWDLGEGLGEAATEQDRRDELGRVRELIRTVRDLPDGTPRLTAGTVGSLFPQYAQYGSQLDLMGVEIRAVGAMQEPLDTFRYLAQRRTLTATRNPNGLFWAWVPASSPSAVRSAVWGLDVPPAWGWPQVQPEQMRIYANAALSAGYRGLGFRGDAELTRPGALARLYEASLLIAEIDLIDSILARAGDPIPQWDTFPPDPKPKMEYNSSGMVGGFNMIGRSNSRDPEEGKEVRAHGTIKMSSLDAVDGRTKLLIVTDFAGGAQWQPPKMAVYDLNLLLPAPESAQAFEISLGGVRPLECRRDPGGRRIVLPTFNTSALILLTTDLNVMRQAEAFVESLRPRAVDIALRQAELQIAETETIHRLLLQNGQDVRDSAQLLAKARELLQSAREAAERQDYQYAWSEARAVGQPLRMLMRAQWDRAYDSLVKDVEAAAKRDGVPPMYDKQGRTKRPAPFVSPVACPPLLSWQTLPQFSYWRDRIRGAYGPFGPNRIPTGSFDDASAIREAGWSDAGRSADGVRGSFKINRKEGWGPQPSSLTLRVEPSEQVDRDRFRGPDGKIDEEAYKQALFDSIDALPPFLDHPVAAVRSPAVPVPAQSFVRIRVLVKLPREIPDGAGGLIVRDSLGGEALQFRSTAAIPGWREVVLYRRAPADGEVSVLLGLAGFGQAHFDELRIDVMGEPAELARRPEPAPAPPTPAAPTPSRR